MYLCYYVRVLNGIEVPVIAHVKASSASEKAGIQVNDIIVALDGNAIKSYEIFSSVFGSFGRPLTMT